ncbi:MAG TPA: helix-turn-helix domain-containing protein [Rhodopila sp.]|nr:helix-turn-helix domain-containing protein [Rhodopila sp.]
MFQDTARGAQTDMSQLHKVLAVLEADAVLMVTQRNRPAWSTRDLLNTLSTSKGRERAKTRGVKMGRPPKLTPHQVKDALRRRNAGEPMRDIARSDNVSHSTMSRRKA